MFAFVPVVENARAAAHSDPPELPPLVPPDPNDPSKLVFDRNQLEAWLRNPPALLPMAPDEARGMPNLHLTEQQIDDLVSYLETLGPYPANAVDPTKAGS